MGSDLDTCAAFRCERLQPQNNPFPTKYLREPGTVLVGHRCFVFGGMKSKYAFSNASYFFDTVAMKWHEAEIMQSSLLVGEFKVACVVEDLLFAYLWLSEESRHEMLMLDMVLLDCWKHLIVANVPQIGLGTAGCYHERRNELIFIGGKDESLEQVYRYHVLEQRWDVLKTRGNPPPRRMYHSICTSGTAVFVVGGSILEASHKNQCDIHILTMGASPYTWSSPAIGGIVPWDRSWFRAVCTGNRVLAYGGYNRPKTFDLFALRENRWYKGRRTIQSPNHVVFRSESPYSVFKYAAVQTGASILIFGGIELPIATPLRISPD